MAWILWYGLAATMMLGIGIAYDDGKDGLFWLLAAIFWPIFTVLFVTVTITLAVKRRVK